MNSSNMRKMFSIIAIIVMIAPFADTVQALGRWETLDVGFENCLENGYSTHDWEDYYTESFWGAFAGHNCTNYAAYMAILNGAETRIGGNASAWAENAKEAGYIVNNTPAVGAIAQWDANTQYFSEAGHVAYVEEVRNNYIIVSEDNYSGTFQWRKIYEDECWPSNFIHVGDGQIASGKEPADNAIAVIVNPDTGITTADVNLSGYIKNPKKQTVTEVGIEIGTRKNNLKQAGSDETDYAYLSFNMHYSQKELSIDLSPDTTYYYRLYAVSKGQTYYSEISSFTTGETE